MQSAERGSEEGETENGSIIEARLRDGEKERDRRSERKIEDSPRKCLIQQMAKCAIGGVDKKKMGR